MTSLTQRDFIDILESHLADPGFRSDTDNLLRQCIDYDSRLAGSDIRTTLLNLLPEAAT